MWWHHDGDDDDENGSDDEDDNYCDDDSDCDGADDNACHDDCGDGHFSAVDSIFICKQGRQMFWRGGRSFFAGIHVQPAAK